MRLSDVAASVPTPMRAARENAILKVCTGIT